MRQYYYLWANHSQYERERLGLCNQSKSDAEKSMLVANFVQFITAFFSHFFQKGIFVKTVIGVFTMVFLWFDFNKLDKIGYQISS
jgi:hypothetical protein